MTPTPNRIITAIIAPNARLSSNMCINDSSKSSRNDGGDGIDLPSTLLYSFNPVYKISYVLSLPI